MSEIVVFFISAINQLFFCDKDNCSVMAIFSPFQVLTKCFQP